MSLKRNLIFCNFCNSLYQNIVIFGSLSFKLKLYRILDLCDISVQLLGCILQASYLGMIHQCVILCKIICSVVALRSHFYYRYDFIMLELFQLIFFTVQNSQVILSNLVVVVSSFVLQKKKTYCFLFIGFLQLTSMQQGNAPLLIEVKCRMFTFST